MNATAADLRGGHVDKWAAPRIRSPWASASAAERDRRDAGRRVFLRLDEKDKGGLVEPVPGYERDAVHAHRRTAPEPAHRLPRRLRPWADRP
jgi:hypothetical protein